MKLDEPKAEQFGKLTILQLSVPRPWLAIHATSTIPDGLGCNIQLTARDARMAVQSLRALANAIAAGAGELTLVEN